jgi:plasmid stabilization system protein ParE
VTELTWSPQAVRDLEGIRAYIALDSPQYADLTVRRIVAAVERLQQFPESGRIVPERNTPDIREVMSPLIRQIRTLPVDRIGPRIAKASEEELARVVDGLNEILE